MVRAAVYSPMSARTGAPLALSAIDSDLSSRGGVPPTGDFARLRRRREARATAGRQRRRDASLVMIVRNRSLELRLYRDDSFAPEHLRHTRAHKTIW